MLESFALNLNSESRLGYVVEHSTAASEHVKRAELDSMGIPFCPLGLSYLCRHHLFGGCF